MLIQAVGVNLPPSYVCLEGPLGGERPRAQGDEMLMQRLLPAVREALDEAAVKPEEIDLIVGLALSPDHLIENRDIMAPKIGHPLQKVLGANRAHVFDLTDSSLARALYVVDTSPATRAIATSWSCAANPARDWKWTASPASPLPTAPWRCSAGRPARPRSVAVRWAVIRRRNGCR